MRCSICLVVRRFCGRNVGLERALLHLLLLPEATRGLSLMTNTLLLVRPHLVEPLVRIQRCQFAVARRSNERARALADLRDKGALSSGVPLFLLREPLALISRRVEQQPREPNGCVPLVRRHGLGVAGVSDRGF